MRTNNYEFFIILVITNYTNSFQNSRLFGLILLYFDNKLSLYFVFDFNY